MGTSHLVTDRPLNKPFDVHRTEMLVHCECIHPTAHINKPVQGIQLVVRIIVFVTQQFFFSAFFRTFRKQMDRHPFDLSQTRA